MESRMKELKVGERAVITGYGKVPREYRQRLLAMGLTKGVEVTLTRIAPLGDPIDIEVRGFNLTLRKDEADALLISRVS